MNDQRSSKSDFKNIINTLEKWSNLSKVELNNLCFTLLTQNYKYFQEAIPLNKSLKIEIQIFHGDDKFDSSETKFYQSSCSLCTQIFQDVYFLSFHLLIFHSDYYVIGVIFPTGANSRVSLTLIKKEPSLVQRSYKLGLSNFSSPKERNLFKARRLLSTIFLNARIAENKVITLYETLDNQHVKNSYEYWLFGDQNQPQALFDKHLKKIDNLLLDRDLTNFMKIWNKFIFEFKRKLLSSNHFFSNFLNSEIETFAFLVIFIKENRDSMLRIEPNFRLHVLNAMICKLITSEEASQVLRISEYYINKEISNEF